MRAKQTLVVIAMLLLVSSLASPVSALGKGHPDLEVMSFEAVVGSPIIGVPVENSLTPVVLNWTIANNGKKPVASFDAQLINGDDIVETISYSGLPPWSSVVGQKELYLLPGEYTFSLVVDPTNEIRERSESNNRMTVDVSIPLPPPPPPRLPNLVVSEVELIHLSPVYYPSVGDLIGVTFTVTNSGEAPVRETSIKIKLNEELIIREMNIGSLPSGESQEIQAMSNHVFQTPGSHKIDVTVDPDDLIVETCEWDNYDKIEVFVYPNGLPNVALSNCFAYGGNQQPGYALPGDFLCFSCDIENNGEAPAPDFELLVQVDGMGIGGEVIFYEVMDLKPGEKRTITANTNWQVMMPGPVGVNFIAETWFKEVTYGDNIVSTKVDVAPSPGILP